MTVTYRTVVLHVPPTPLGLLPERWTVQHWCNLCRQRVAPEALVAHAQDHEHANSNRSFQSQSASGTMTPDQPDPTEDTTPGIPDASTTTTDQRRR